MSDYHVTWDRLFHTSIWGISTFVPLLWQGSTEKVSWGGGLSCFIPPAKWKRIQKYFCLLTINSDNLRKRGGTPPKALYTITPSCWQAHICTVSELTHAAWNTLTSLNNFKKCTDKFDFLWNYSVLMLSLSENSEMLAVHTESSGDAEIFKYRNWPKKVTHTFFIQIACILCGWTTPWICVVKQSTDLAGLTSTEMANHCRSWQYNRGH